MMQVLIVIAHPFANAAGITIELVGQYVLESVKINRFGVARFTHMLSRRPSVLYFDWHID